MKKYLFFLILNLSLNLFCQYSRPYIDGSGNFKAYSSSHTEGNSNITFDSLSHIQGSSNFLGLPYSSYFKSDDYTLCVINADSSWFTFGINYLVNNYDRYNPSSVIRIHPVTVVSKDQSGIYAYLGISEYIPSGAYQNIIQNNRGFSSYGSSVSGASNYVTGIFNHCEGFRNDVFSDYSHTEGRYNTTIGDYSHVEGYVSKSDTAAVYSHVEGSGGIACYPYQHVESGYYRPYPYTPSPSSEPDGSVQFSSFHLAKHTFWVSSNNLEFVTETGRSSIIQLKASTMYTLRVLLNACNTDGTHRSAYEIKAHITALSGGTFLDTLIVNAVYETDAAMDAAITVNSSGNYFQLRYAHPYIETVRAYAYVEMIEQRIPYEM